MKMNFYLFGIADQLGVSPTNCMQCAFIAISCIKMQVLASTFYQTTRENHKKGISLSTFSYYNIVQQVLEYRDKGVQKFQKIPIFEFSGSLQSTY